MKRYTPIDESLFKRERKPSINLNNYWGYSKLSKLKISKLWERFKEFMPNQKIFGSYPAGETPLQPSGKGGSIHAVPDSVSV